MSRVSLRRNNVRRPVAPQHPTANTLSMQFCEAKHAHHFRALCKCQLDAPSQQTIPLATLHATCGRNTCRCHRVHDDNESFNYPNNYTGKAHLVGSEKYAKPTNKTSNPNSANKQTNEMLPSHSHAHWRIMWCASDSTFNKSAYTSCLHFRIHLGWKKVLFHRARH